VAGPDACIMSSRRVAERADTMPKILGFFRQGCTAAGDRVAESNAQVNDALV